MFCDHQRISGLVQLLVIVFAGLLPVVQAEEISVTESVSDGDESVLVESAVEPASVTTVADEGNLEENGASCFAEQGCYSEPAGVCNCRDCLRNNDRWFMASPDRSLLIGGWLEQGFTWNSDSPANRFNAPVLFNDRSNEYQLNQLYLYLDKPVVVNGCDWDFGGRVDLLFGTDFRFVSVPGLENHNDGSRRWNAEDRRFYGLAMPQAFGEIAVPVGNGLRVKIGHFYSIVNFERVPATENFFYSHSYSFANGEPFTHTGALVSYHLNENVVIHAGVTTGWDNWEHPGREAGFVGGLEWHSCDGWTSLAVSATAGKDLTGVRVGGQRVDEDRFFWNLILRRKLTDCLTYVFQHDFGDQQGAEVDINLPANTVTFGDAQWYSITQYLFYDVTPCLQAGLRFEWFDDLDSSRLGVPTVFNPGGNIFTGNDYYALTAGLNWRPRENLTLRPEVRWDWSNFRGNPNVPGGNAAARAFDDRTDGSQLLLAMDVILTF